MQLEPLEARRLLSGNVTVTVDGPTIRVVGDSKSNEITVTGNGPYTITGQNGTTVNRGPSVITLTGMEAFDVRMGNGDDVVGFTGAVNNALAIDTGNGSDTVSLAFTAVLGDLDIDTGNADDEVFLGFVSVTGHMNVLTGNGADTIEVGAPVSVVFDTLIDGGHGSDSLTGNANLTNVIGTKTIVDVETVA